MSTLNQREDAKLTKMIYDLDVEGVGKRIKKYRMGKFTCMALSVFSIAYFRAYPRGARS